MQNWEWRKLVLRQACEEIFNYKSWLEPSASCCDVTLCHWHATRLESWEKTAVWNLKYCTVCLCREASVCQVCRFRSLLDKEAKVFLKCWYCTYPSNCMMSHPREILISKLLLFTIRFSRLQNQYKVNTVYYSNLWDLHSFLFLTSTLF